MYDDRQSLATSSMLVPSHLLLGSEAVGHSLYSKDEAGVWLTFSGGQWLPSELDPCALTAFCLVVYTRCGLCAHFLIVPISPACINLGAGVILLSVSDHHGAPLAAASGGPAGHTVGM
jgi:hypothetical protein